MEEALRLSASAVVVVHNHLSGEATPSPQDIETTQKMKQATPLSIMKKTGLSICLNLGIQATGFHLI
jgi:DNA repair protein RadC